MGPRGFLPVAFFIALPFVGRDASRADDSYRVFGLLDEDNVPAQEGIRSAAIWSALGQQRAKQARSAPRSIEQIEESRAVALDPQPSGSATFVRGPKTQRPYKPNACRAASLDDGCEAESLLTPAQAAAQFHIPEYLLRKACSEGRLEHLRIVNALWLTPAAMGAFATAWRAKQGEPKA